MSITTNGGDTIHPEVERLRRKSGHLQEGHDEAPETAIHVEANVVSSGKSSETDDIILAAVGEIDRRTYDLSIFC